MATKTVDQVKAELVRKGISRAQWAALNGVSRFVVYQVLSGKNKGLWGEAHRAAVLLGLKDGEIVDPEDAKGALFASEQRKAA